jgi:lathosterol oxidase
MEMFYQLFLDSGNAVVSLWLGIFLVWSLLIAASKLFTYVRTMKIQSRDIGWPMLRQELMWSAFNVFGATFVIQLLSSWLVKQGYLVTDPTPAPWYVIAFEFALYFFIFDLYFYLVHRLIHMEPLYRWIHQRHHRSLSPNPLSYASMSPLEGIVEGMIIPLFITCFTVHETSTWFILPFAPLMGLYVHCGYEFAPRWWYRMPFTKWLITPMYHDQHHQFFTCNYGAYTTLWDRLFSTMRGRFAQDFIKLKNRGAVVVQSPETTQPLSTLKEETR